MVNVTAKKALAALLSAIELSPTATNIAKEIKPLGVGPEVLAALEAAPRRPHTGLGVHFRPLGTKSGGAA